MESLPPGSAALAPPLFDRLVRLLDVFARGGFVVYGSGVDASYLTLRRGLLGIVASEACFAGIDHAALTDALPPLLGEFPEAAAASVWDELYPVVAGWQGQALAACLADPAVSGWAAADEAMSSLGWDELIARFAAEKRRLTEQEFRRLGFRVRSAPETAPGAEAPPPQPGRHQRRASERRERVAALNAEGKSRKEIARELGISERHVYKILADLAANDHAA